MSHDLTQPTPELEPLAVDGISAVKLGTLIWAIAFIVCLIARKPLQQLGIKDAHWICLAGVVLGGLGLIYTRRRVDRLKLVSDIVND